MPNLRDMIDGTTITAAAPVPKKPSPVAQHVSNHIQDPVGATKEGFGELQDAKLKYDMEREKMQRNLAPVQSVMQHVSQVHGIQPGMGTPGMGVADQGGMNSDNPDVDEDGNPIDPEQARQPGQMGQNNPIMSKMNQGRPSVVGTQPGVAPGAQKQVVPQKMGMPKPGGPGASNSPQPKGAGVKPVAKTAKPPAKGGGKAPAKAAPKGGASGREVKINVTASRGVLMGSERNLESQFGLGVMKCGVSGMAKTARMPNPGSSTRPSLRSGTDSVSDKEGDPLAYNAKMNAGHKKGCMCANCSKAMKSAGRSKGAKKGWSTRGKGHLSKTEKAAHYATM